MSAWSAYLTYPPSMTWKKPEFKSPPPLPEGESKRNERTPGTRHSLACACTRWVEVDTWGHTVAHILSSSYDSPTMCLRLSLRDGGTGT